MGPYRHILAPTDFSEPSLRAVRAASDLAVALGAKLTLLHVFEIPAYLFLGMQFASDPVAPLEAAARSLLASTLEAARKKTHSVSAQFRSGVPWEQVLAAAAEGGVDLIVMGTHGRSGIAHVLIGSVTERVVRHSPIPVLTIRTSAA